jgi:hypothetical protein
VRRVFGRHEFQVCLAANMKRGKTEKGRARGQQC